MNKVKTYSENGTRAKKKAVKVVKPVNGTQPVVPSRKKAKKELTASELTLLAWQDTYAKRHQRVA